LTSLGLRAMFEAAAAITIAVLQLIIPWQYCEPSERLPTSESIVRRLRQFSHTPQYWTSTKPEYRNKQVDWTISL